MPIQLVWSNGNMQKLDDLSKLIATHRQALKVIEVLGTQLMDADGEDSLLIGQRLDAAFANEAVARRRVASVPVKDMRQVKMKAAYFQRLLSKGWCDLEPADIRALLRSFANLPV